MEPIVYKAREVAAILNLSVLTIYKLMKKGEIPSITIGGNKRVTKESLCKLIGVDTI